MYSHYASLFTVWKRKTCIPARWLKWAKFSVAFHFFLSWSSSFDFFRLSKLQNFLFFTKLDESLRLKTAASTTIYGVPYGLLIRLTVVSMNFDLIWNLTVVHAHVIDKISAIDDFPPSTPTGILKKSSPQPQHVYKSSKFCMIFSRLNRDRCRLIINFATWWWSHLCLIYGGWWSTLIWSTQYECLTNEWMWNILWEFNSWKSI